MEYCDFFRPDKVGSDFGDGFKHVANFQRLKQPGIRRVEPLEKEMIALDLLTERKLLRAQPQFVNLGGED
jgi:hypothetical protein